MRQHIDELHTTSRGSSFTWSSHDERISSTLSPPFPSTSSSSHSSLTSCTSSCTSSTTLRAVATLRTSPERRWTPLTTGYEPNAYDLKETYVESYTESLTHPQFSEQGFLEDVEYDDTALEDMLHEAHRVQQLYKVSTLCIDDHHFKEEETKSFGELSHVCSQTVL